MTTSAHALEPSFLALQRAKLLALRSDLQRSMDGDADEAVQAELIDAIEAVGVAARGDDEDFQLRQTCQQLRRE